MGRLLLTMLLVVESATAPTLAVYPRVVFAGSGVRVQCRVPRHTDNRAVTWGFTDWTSLGRQLDGADAPITWAYTFNDVPCDPGLAFCRVERVRGAAILMTQSLTVAGCGGY